MTEREALKMALEALEAHADIGIKSDKAITAIKEALAQPEPVKIAHKHEWFRTGEMKVGQMRCISCGTWGKEEITQRIWVGLTDEEIKDCFKITPDQHLPWHIYQRIEAKLKEKNSA